MTSLGSSIGVIGAAISLGQKKAGVSLGPEYLRRAGLLDILRTKNHVVTDWGDVSELILPDEQELKKRADQSEKVLREADCYAKLFEQCQQMWRQHELVVTLGGDHSIAACTIGALLKSHPDAIVIWIDAHGDINTPESSPTGNWHGMPVAALLRLFDPRSSGHFQWLSTEIKPSQLIYLGPRSLDPGEVNFIKNLKITHFSTEQLQEHGVGRLLRGALIHKDPQRRRPIHVSFDLDAVDPKLAPATGVPVPNGLSLAEVLAIARVVREHSQVVGLDLVELNPELAASAAELDASIDVFRKFVSELV